MGNFFDSAVAKPKSEKENKPVAQSKTLNEFDWII